MRRQHVAAGEIGAADGTRRLKPKSIPQSRECGDSNSGVNQFILMRR
jgi:hypothetical protein